MFSIIPALIERRYSMGARDAYLNITALDGIGLARESRFR